MKKHRRHSRRRRRNRAIIGISLLVMVLVGGMILVTQLEKILYPTTEDINPMSRSSLRIQFEDQWYVPKENIVTTLIIGIDQYGEQEATDTNRNDAMADFPTLLVQDLSQNIITVVPLNRDTITDVPVIGINGRTAGTIQTQLAVAYSYGSGDIDSALNTVQAVENLLGGNISIDHYIVSTMDGIAILNDMVGGVPVTIDDDLSMADASLIQGQTVTLRGDQAVTYVRSRMGVADGTNINRMARQETYMKSWVSQLQQNGFDDDMITQLSDYILTDYSITQLQAFADQITLDTTLDIATIAGTSIIGEEFTEFYADEADIEKVVISLFYEKEN